MQKALRASALLVALSLGLGTLAAAPAGEKMQTATGNVAKLQATERAVIVAVDQISGLELGHRPSLGV